MPVYASLYVRGSEWIFTHTHVNPNHHQYRVEAKVNKVSKVQAALLSEAQLKQLQEGDRAHVGKDVARNMFFVRHDILLSTEQIRKLQDALMWIPTQYRRKSLSQLGK